MPALKAIEKRSASPPSVRVAAACNTCNTSDRDEEEACSGRWRAELREDRVLNDFALRPRHAVPPPSRSLAPSFFWYGGGVTRRTPQFAGIALCTDFPILASLSRIFSELPYKPRYIKVYPALSSLSLPPAEVLDHFCSADMIKWTVRSMRVKLPTWKSWIFYIMHS